jgi:hypothetical protein
MCICFEVIVEIPSSCVMEFYSSGNSQDGSFSYICCQWNFSHASMKHLFSPDGLCKAQLLFQINLQLWQMFYLSRLDKNSSLEKEMVLYCPKRDRFFNGKWVLDSVELGVVIYTCNPSTRLAVAGRSQIWGQLGTHSKTRSQKDTLPKTKPKLKPKNQNQSKKNLFHGWNLVGSEFK